jgi:hypothetical protein
MKRLLMTAFAVATVGFAALPASSKAETSVGVDINVGDPYRGGAIHFRSEPDLVLVPDTRVYYVRDYDHDVYRYGSYWYFIDDGRWYRARTYRGPFAYIHTASVPRSIVMVPASYRRHWGGPPPHAVARGYRRNHDDRWVDRDDRDRDRDGDRDRDRDRGRGRGHGRGR